MGGIEGEDLSMTHDAMVIPRSPQVLVLPIVTQWDGTLCTDARLHGLVTLSVADAGLRITASLPQQDIPHNPGTPLYSRVANLWEYDVVECFVVGAEHYLEVELGAGGHFLVLAFSRPRVCSNTYEGWTPQMAFEPAMARGTVWRSSILIPWTMVPVGIKGVNAHVISGEHYLCYHPLPGPRPDFHQPDRFPAVRLAGKGLTALRPHSGAGT
jgi:hypothetical protein